MKPQLRSLHFFFLFFFYSIRLLMLHITTNRKHEPIKEDCGIIVLIILGNINLQSKWEGEISTIITKHWKNAACLSVEGKTAQTWSTEVFLKKHARTHTHAAQTDEHHIFYQAPRARSSTTKYNLFHLTRPPCFPGIQFYKITSCTLQMFRCMREKQLLFSMYPCESVSFIKICSKYDRK